MNQVPTPISQKSAKVLHTIITEVLSEAWLDKQQELLTYCSEIFKYRRTLHRRVYHGKSQFLLKFSFIDPSRIYLVMIKNTF